MTEVSPIQTEVARKEGNMSLAAQKNNDLVVLHSFSANIDSNLGRSNSGSFKLKPLAVEDVLVKDDQAGARSNTYSGIVYCDE